jgi:hypothetical protein
MGETMGRSNMFSAYCGRQNDILRVIPAATAANFSRQVMVRTVKNIAASR